MKSILWIVLLLSVQRYAADVTFGTATARPGQRANGFLEVPAGADAARQTARHRHQRRQARTGALPDLPARTAPSTRRSRDAQAGAVGGPRRVFRERW